MNSEQLAKGLRENWYLIAALVVFVALAAVKLVTGSDADETQKAADNQTAGEKLPNASDTLQELQRAARPNPEEQARRQIEEYREKLAEEPESEDAPAYYMAMGNLQLQKFSDYEEAAKAYEQVILEFPEWEGVRKAYLQLEACYQKQEDRTGLKWLYEKMVEAFPEESNEYEYATKQLEAL
jgi:tetratricopeptide (TPR) repeat protein